MAPPRHRASFAAWVAKRRPTGLRARHTYDLDRSITNAPTAAGHLSGWDYQHRPGPSPYAASQRFAQDDRRTFSDPTFGGASDTITVDNKRLINIVQAEQ